ncbi:MAG: hypothetical protein LUC93_15315 [Planctomycetaceae bacterium]|nr:hypothetical protein [Planctomycetaceae bacterium]
MADEQDSHNSRFLFSDLDVSDKGRPSRDAASTPAPESATTSTAFATPLTSIAELASSLEFGFEDDFDDVDFKAGVADAEEAARPVYKQSGFLVGEDPELDLLADRLTTREIYQPAFPELAADGSAAVPTWEEFTQAFDLVREPGETDAQFAARRWREARRRRRAQTEGEFAGDGEKAEDPLLDEEVDILSVVDPDEWRFLDETVSESAEAEAPVEEEHDNPAATQVINPRERLAALELAAREAEAEAQRLAELGPEPEPEPTGVTDTETVDYLPNPNPTDTLHEMFSDVDLEALWQQQIEKRNRARSSGRHGKADSRVVDLFDEVDLEAAWEERKKAGPKDGTTRFPELAIGETLVLEPGMLDSGQTTVMDPRNMPEFPPQTPSHRETPSSAAAKPSDSVMSRYRLSSGEGATLEADIGYAEEDDVSAPGEQAGGPQEAVSEEEAFGDLQSLLDPEEGTAGSHEFVSGINAPTITTDDVINTINLDDEPINVDISAPVIDDSAITSVQGPRPGTEEMQAIMGEYDEEAGGEGTGEGEEAVAVDPMDVFANMDELSFDFSDDMDDEMRAMLDEDGEAVTDEDAEGHAEGTEASPDDIPPDGRVAKLVWRLRRYAKRHMPEKAVSIFDQIQGAIAWKENWWFYCDLVAAIIASASLAVIISYYIWYR